MVWNYESARIEGRQAIFALPLEGYGFGAVLAVTSGAAVEGLASFLGTMKERAKVPLQSLSDDWHSLTQQLVEIAPTKPARSAPGRNGVDSRR